MNCIDFPEANHTFGKPLGWTDEECSSARAWIGQTVDEPHRPVLITCWEPTDEEIKELVEGKKLYIQIFHDALPPMSIWTSSPFLKEPDL